MIVSIIVAVGEKGEMGLHNQLPWYLPADMKYFKTTTAGHHVVMGRKTYESLGKPLPNRVNVVITRNPDFKADARIVTNIQSAIDIAEEGNEKECFILGGADIFKQSIPLCDKMYITRIHQTFEADTFFPAINVSDWKLESSEAHEPDEKNKYSYTFEVYVKKPL